MQDVVGCRIIVDAVIEQEEIARRVMIRFPNTRVVDRRLNPSFGYRALHLVIHWNDSPYEVQVRTKLQHAWAEVVERLSDREYPDLKYGKADGVLPRALMRLSETIREIEETEHAVSTEPETSETRELAARSSRTRASILDILDELGA